MEPLNPVETRVLGALVEKDLTTPDYYPLSLNALTNACNQSSNRDPVVSFSEEAVVRGLDSLREKKLAFMFQGADSRVSRYGHRIVEFLGLDRPGTSVLCVLLLRGPQTLGEVRSRTARMHEFPSLEDAEICLAALAGRPDPLVAKLPRMAGMKEQRYAHLLSGPVDLESTAPSPVTEPAVLAVRFENERLEKLERESSSLKAEVSELRQQLSELKKLLE